MPGDLVALCKMPLPRGRGHCAATAFATRSSLHRVAHPQTSPGAPRRGLGPRHGAPCARCPPGGAGRGRQDREGEPEPAGAVGVPTASSAICSCWESAVAVGRPDPRLVSLPRQPPARHHVGPACWPWPCSWRGAGPTVAWEPADCQRPPLAHPPSLLPACPQETHGRKVLLARTRGEVYATDAHCFHMGGNL